MRYALVVWEGTRPADDAAGRRVCDEMLDRYLDAERVAPTPAIRNFVAELTKDWPDAAADPRSDRAMRTFPHLLTHASGPALFVSLRTDAPVLASTLVAAKAERCGLVTYDPQVAMLRPVSEKVITRYERRWASALN